MSSPTNFTDEHRTPTAITQTKPPIVTSANHGLSNGQRVRATQFYSFPLALATGMEKLNNKLFTVQAATTNTFALYDQYGQPIDATAYTAFVNNGLAQFTLTGPSLLIQNPAPDPP
jgi:hypothetical protein